MWTLRGSFSRTLGTAGKSCRGPLCRRASRHRPMDLPPNPFSRGLSLEPSPSASASGPSEGGILMLHDLQESQASRAALVSAWRDYGPQARARSARAPLPPPFPPVPVSRHGLL